VRAYKDAGIINGKRVSMAPNVDDGSGLTPEEKLENDKQIFDEYVNAGLCDASDWDSEESEDDEE
jgi:hypothetical protein